jgi:hypothetical protein
MAIDSNELYNYNTMLPNTKLHWMLSQWQVQELKRNKFRFSRHILFSILFHIHTVRS